MRGSERRYTKERNAGEQTAKDQMILNMVRKNYPVEDIAEVADVTIEYVVKVKDGGLQIV